MQERTNAGQPAQAKGPKDPGSRVQGEHKNSRPVTFVNLSDVCIFCVKFRRTLTQEKIHFITEFYCNIS